jgi:hypothetical protein
MIKTYQSFDEIDRDLKRLSLERRIAIEELKMVKSDFEDSLRPISILISVFDFVRKYGILLLIKKMFR